MNLRVSERYNIQSAKVFILISQLIQSLSRIDCRTFSYDWEYGHETLLGID